VVYRYQSFGKIFSFHLHGIRDKVHILSRYIFCSTETLIDVSKKFGLEVNTEKTKYILLSRHQNGGQNYDIKIANRSFENATQFKYLGTTVTYQNLIDEEMKRILNSGNAYCH
jgi:hypothetical protein